MEWFCESQRWKGLSVIGQGSSPLTLLVSSTTWSPILPLSPNATRDSDTSYHRYDARLLLQSFSDISIANNPIPDDEDELACSSWADFPEDSRETFFLSPEQAEDYHRIKRRRMIDEAHERRLREREEEDRNAAEAEAAAFDPGEVHRLALALSTFIHL